MKSVGIRELRQRASEYVRLVEQGERVQITDRGRPVALMVPIPSRSLRDELIAKGRLRPAKGHLRDLGPPLPPKPGVPLPSEILEEMRRDER